MTKYQHYQCRVLLRVLVIERDKVCQRCGKQIHDTCHVRSVGAYKHMELMPDNVLGLCRTCHVWFDNHQEESRKWFTYRWPDREEKLLKAQQELHHPYISSFEQKQKIKEQIEIIREINKPR